MTKSAFPYKHMDLDCETNKRYEKFDEGMELRDYFAAKVLQVFASQWVKKAHKESNFSEIAFMSYLAADQMMEARKK